MVEKVHLSLDMTTPSCRRGRRRFRARKWLAIASLVSLACLLPPERRGASVPKSISAENLHTFDS